MPEFRVQLAREAPALGRYANFLCRGSPWSEDLCQETFLLALRLEKTFTLGTNLRAWLFALMKNIYRNEARKDRRRSVLIKQEYAEGVTGEASHNQEMSVILAQTLRSMDALPEIYRDVLFLVAIDGLTYAETAQILDTPVGTVRSRLARARELLKVSERVK